MYTLDPFTGNVVRGSRSGGGSGNATVPEDAVIQPPQAFVNIAPSIMGVLLANPLSYVSDPAMTYIEPSLGYTCVFNGGGTDFSPCALTDANVDALLSAIASSNSTNGTIYLYGPNMGKPTPVAEDIINADLAVLIGLGWHGDYKGTDGSQVTF